MQPAAFEPLLGAAPLLRRTDAALVRLLASIETEAEWNTPAAGPRWTVRDVAAHLLDTALRKLSLARDGCFVEQPRAGESIVAFVNRLNAEGVTVYRRLSPRVLIAAMERACEESADFHEALDPFAPALFGVSWAGETSSANWFDTARELTERWHHQQQIREALGRGVDEIRTPELYRPVLACFLRGLPHHFRGWRQERPAVLRIEIPGPCGGRWTLTSGASEAPSWLLRKAAGDVGCDASLTIPDSIAWRIFTKGIRYEDALRACAIEGDAGLASHVLTLAAIVG